MHRFVLWSLASTLALSASVFVSADTMYISDTLGTVHALRIAEEIRWELVGQMPRLGPQHTALAFRPVENCLYATSAYSNKASLLHPTTLVTGEKACSGVDYFDGVLRFSSTGDFCYATAAIPGVKGTCGVLIDSTDFAVLRVFEEGIAGAFPGGGTGFATHTACFEYNSSRLLIWDYDRNALCAYTPRSGAREVVYQHQETMFPFWRVISEAEKTIVGLINILKIPNEEVNLCVKDGHVVSSFTVAVVAGVQIESSRLSPLRGYVANDGAIACLVRKHTGELVESFQYPLAVLEKEGEAELKTLTPYRNLTPDDATGPLAPMSIMLTDGDAYTVFSFDSGGGRRTSGYIAVRDNRSKLWSDTAATGPCAPLLAPDWE